MVVKRIIFEAIRVPECILVFLLGYLGFGYTTVPINSLALLGLFFIAAATMLQNGWRDRHHDIEKGKDLAIRKPILYISLLVIFWALGIGTITVISQTNTPTALMLLAFAFVGAVYSEVRTLPLLSIILVTCTVGSAVLIPVTLGADFAELQLLFMATILLMFGRENLHDIADQKVDAGYKKTIPLVFGDTFARMASAISLILGSVVAFFITPYSIGGASFIIWGLKEINDEVTVTGVRKWCDVGLILLIASLVVNLTSH